MTVEPSTTMTASASSQGRYVARPGVVTFICVVNSIGLSLQALVAALYLFGVFTTARTLDLPLAITFAIMFGISLAIVLGLWYAKNWARWGYVGYVLPLTLLELWLDTGVTNGIRAAVIVLMSILLFRPKASAYFRGEALPAIDPASGLEIGTREIIPCPSCGKEIYSTLAKCHHCGSALEANSSTNEPTPPT